MAAYGTKFSDAFRGVAIATMKEVWRHGIKKNGLSSDELAAGMAKCLDGSQKWPPTLPEFIALCRPPVDFEADFEVTVEQLHAREKRADVWPRRAMYWAAVEFGGDILTLTYPAAKKRWHRVYSAALEAEARGELAEVPPKPMELAYNPSPVPMPEHIRRKLAPLLRRMNVTPTAQP